MIIEITQKTIETNWIVVAYTLSTMVNIMRFNICMCGEFHPTLKGLLISFIPIGLVDLLLRISFFSDWAIDIQEGKQ